MLTKYKSIGGYSPGVRAFGLLEKWFPFVRERAHS